MGPKPFFCIDPREGIWVIRTQREAPGVSDAEGATTWD